MNRDFNCERKMTIISWTKNVFCLYTLLTMRDNYIDKENTECETFPLNEKKVVKFDFQLPKT